MNEVDILLGTYNGERFLPELLKSLEEQTFKDWNLIARDDCSKDNTKKILLDFKNKHPDNVFIIEEIATNLGACKNFLKLLEFSKGEYILFCDQDDVWLPNKLEVMLDKAKEIEKRYPDIPFLIHSDLRVVDEGLREIAPSFWKYQFIRPDYCNTLPKLLITNSVTGCATLINKKLKELIIPAPDNIVMHDWWCALVTSAFGKIFWIPDRLVLYRQHGTNDVGAKAWNFSYIIRKAISFYNRDALLKGFYMTVKQAETFYGRYKHILDPEKEKIVKAYINLDQQNFFRKRLDIIKFGFLRTGLIRNIGFLLRI